MAAIYRRGKTYWARAQRKGQEQRRSLKTTNRSIAEKRLRQWLEELDAIAWGDKPRRSWLEAVEKFIIEHLPTLKPKGAERYGHSIKHLTRHFGAKMLHEITPAEMSEFEQMRRLEGVRPATILRDFRCLSSMMESAIDWEWAESNPVLAYLKRRSRRGLKPGDARTRYLTPDEEQRLLAMATSMHTRTKSGKIPGKASAAREAMILAIDTGLRRDELLGLKWRQVDLIRGLIDTETRTKSGRARKVPVPARSAQLLAQLPRSINGYVLVNPETGERYVQLIRGLRAAARRAGIKDLRWHDLRRTAGCRWLQRDGRSMEEVSTMLGHSSVMVTEKSYAFIEAETVAESISRTKTGTTDTA